MSNDYDYGDEAYLPPQTRWEDEIGCLFPGECCMPGEHRKSECHTAEDLEALGREATGEEGGQQG
jgi:hypothetical protein